MRVPSANIVRHPPVPSAPNRPRFPVTSAGPGRVTPIAPCSRVAPRNDPPTTLPVCGGHARAPGDGRPPAGRVREVCFCGQPSIWNETCLTCALAYIGAFGSIGLFCFSLLLAGQP